MIKKIYIFLLFLLIGFFIIPIQGYACETHSAKKENTTTRKVVNKVISKLEPKTEKSCCATSKHTTSTTYKHTSKQKECCQKYPSTKKEKKCDSSCTPNSCHCSISCQSSGILAITEVKILFFEKTPFSDFDIEKEKINYNENFLSSGFLSLWLPPKIA